MSELRIYVTGIDLFYNETTGVGTVETPEVTSTTEVSFAETSTTETTKSVTSSADVTISTTSTAETTQSVTSSIE